MSWRERRQPASFKGVAFFVDVHQMAMGRRVSVRRLSGRDGSVQQDLGEEPDQLEVEGFLSGDNYDLDRTILENALRSEGPGTLSLPTRGDLWVRVVRGPFISENRHRGGTCTVRFSCVVEERRDRSIRAFPDTKGQLKTAAADVTDAADTDFLAVFDVAGLPGKYVTQAVTAVQSVSTALRRVMGKINGTLNPVEDLSAEIDNLSDAAADIISTPATVQTSISGLTLSVFGLANTAKDAIDRTTGLKRTADDPYQQALAARTTFAVSKETNGLGGDEPADSGAELADRNAANVRAIYRLTRANALAAQATNYADVALDSTTRALEILEGLLAEIDAAQDYSASDDLFHALASLRAALSDHLTQTATQLPKAIQVEPRQEVPALLLAHTLYADARLESEIVARNSPRYPLFLSGPLEVLESIG